MWTSYSCCFSVRKALNFIAAPVGLCDCGPAISAATVNFGSGGVSISVSTPTDINLNLFAKAPPELAPQGPCFFEMATLGAAGLTNILLGDFLLREGSVVYDLGNKQVAMASMNISPPVATLSRSRLVRAVLRQLQKVDTSMPDPLSSCSMAGSTASTPTQTKSGLRLQETN
ncbi:hypothetical protein MMC11_004118 [Xylographa trunciseda]|nr:hypothetical protein [Xylographa trunciseda]